MSEKTPTKTNINSSPKHSSIPPSPSTPDNFIDRFGIATDDINLGYKLEAASFDGKWYIGKIVKVDANDHTFLVHFDGWNSRFDEWYEFNSKKVRVIPDEMRSAKKKTVQFKPGDDVLAKWVDNKFYRGEIVSAKQNENYELRFEDNVLFITDATRIRFADKIDLSSESDRLVKLQDTSERKKDREQRIRRRTRDNNNPIQIPILSSLNDDDLSHAVTSIKNLEGLEHDLELKVTLPITGPTLYSLYPDSDDNNSEDFQFCVHECKTFIVNSYSEVLGADLIAAGESTELELLPETDNPNDTIATSLSLQQTPSTPEIPPTSATAANTEIPIVITRSDTTDTNSTAVSELSPPIQQASFKKTRKDTPPKRMKDSSIHTTTNSSKKIKSNSPAISPKSAWPNKLKTISKLGASLNLRSSNQHPIERNTDEISQTMYSKSTTIRSTVPHITTSTDMEDNNNIISITADTSNTHSTRCSSNSSNHDDILTIDNTNTDAAYSSNISTVEPTLEYVDNETNVENTVVSIQSITETSMENSTTPRSQIVTDLCQPLIDNTQLLADTNLTIGDTPQIFMHTNQALINNTASPLSAQSVVQPQGYQLQHAAPDTPCTVIDQTQIIMNQSQGLIDHISQTPLAYATPTPYTETVMTAEGHLILTQPYHSASAQTGADISQQMYYQLIPIQVPQTVTDQTYYNYPYSYSPHYLTPISHSAAAGTMQLSHDMTYQTQTHPNSSSMVSSLPFSTLYHSSTDNSLQPTIIQPLYHADSYYSQYVSNDAAAPVTTIYQLEQNYSSSTETSTHIESYPTSASCAVVTSAPETICVIDNKSADSELSREALLADENREDDSASEEGALLIALPNDSINDDVIPLTSDELSTRELRLLRLPDHNKKIAPKEIINTHSESSFACHHTDCNKKFYRMESLKNHIQTFHEEAQSAIYTPSMITTNSELSTDPTSSNISSCTLTQIQSTAIPHNVTCAISNDNLNESDFLFKKPTTTLTHRSKRKSSRPRKASPIQDTQHQREESGTVIVSLSPTLPEPTSYLSFQSVDDSHNSSSTLVDSHSTKSIRQSKRPKQAKQEFDAKSNFVIDRIIKPPTTKPTKPEVKAIAKKALRSVLKSAYAHNLKDKLEIKSPEKKILPKHFKRGKLPSQTPINTISSSSDVISDDRLPSKASSNQSQSELEMFVVNEEPDQTNEIEVFHTPSTPINMLSDTPSYVQTNNGTNVELTLPSDSHISTETSRIQTHDMQTLQTNPAISSISSNTAVIEADTTSDQLLQEQVNDIVSQLTSINQNTDRKMESNTVPSEATIQSTQIAEDRDDSSHQPTPAANNTESHDETEKKSLEDSIICVCRQDKDEGVMIQCENCLAWQHTYCLGLSDKDLPDEYICTNCSDYPALKKSQYYKHGNSWYHSGHFMKFNGTDEVFDTSEPELSQISIKFHSLKNDLLSLNNYLPSIRKKIEISQLGKHAYLHEFTSQKYQILTQEEIIQKITDISHFTDSLINTQDSYNDATTLKEALPIINENSQATDDDKDVINLNSCSPEIVLAEHTAVLTTYISPTHSDSALVSADYNNIDLSPNYNGNTASSRSTISSLIKETNCFSKDNTNNHNYNQNLHAELENITSANYTRMSIDNSNIEPENFCDESFVVEDNQSIHSEMQIDEPEHGINSPKMQTNGPLQEILDAADLQTAEPIQELDAPDLQTNEFVHQASRKHPNDPENLTTIHEMKTTEPQMTSVHEMQTDQEINAAEMQTDQEINATEMQTDQEINAAEIQTDQEINATEMQTDQNISAAEMQTDQNINAAEMQTDSERQTSVNKMQENDPKQEINASEMQTDDPEYQINEPLQELNSFDLQINNESEQELNTSDLQTNEPMQELNTSDLKTADYDPSVIGIQTTEFDQQTPLSVLGIEIAGPEEEKIMHRMQIDPEINTIEMQTNESGGQTAEPETYSNEYENLTSVHVILDAESEQKINVSGLQTNESEVLICAPEIQINDSAEQLNMPELTTDQCEQQISASGMQAFESDRENGVYEMPKTGTEHETSVHGTHSEQLLDGSEQMNLSGRNNMRDLISSHEPINDIQSNNFLTPIESPMSEQTPAENGILANINSIANTTLITDDPDANNDDDNLSANNVSSLLDPSLMQDVSDSSNIKPNLELNITSSNDRNEDKITDIPEITLQDLDPSLASLLVALNDEEWGCQMRLMEHIGEVQDNLMKQYALIEDRLVTLKAANPQLFGTD